MVSQLLKVKLLHIANFDHKNFSPFLSWKCSFYFDLYDFSKDIREREYQGKQLILTGFKNQRFFFLEKGGLHLISMSL